MDIPLGPLSFPSHGTKSLTRLLQRERRADRYRDFDARYDERGSIWVEPNGNWGEGSVDLVSRLAIAYHLRDKARRGNCET